METSILETVGKVAGIGGVALGVLLIVFREIIRKNIFPKLSPKDSYRLLRTITVLVFAVALAGIGSWVWVSANPAPSAAVEAGQDVRAGGNINVQGSEASGSIKAGRDVNSEGDINIGN